jgi:hypothetical protein
MFKGSQATWRNHFGRPQIGHVSSALVGLIAGAALVLTLTTLDRDENRQPTLTAAVDSASARGTAVEESDTQTAGAAETADVAAIVMPTNGQLLWRALLRPVHFGEPSDAAEVSLAAWEEAAFEATLAQEAFAAVQPEDPALILLMRSRARPVTFGEGGLTPDQRAFVASQEWWAAAVEGR